MRESGRINLTERPLNQGVGQHSRTFSTILTVVSFRPFLLTFLTVLWENQEVTEEGITAQNHQKLSETSTFINFIPLSEGQMGTSLRGESPKETGRTGTTLRIILSSSAGRTGTTLRLVMA